VQIVFVRAFDLGGDDFANAHGVKAAQEAMKALARV
jgi:hypothetical protein